jgi:hypothetical protein
VYDRFRDDAAGLGIELGVVECWTPDQLRLLTSTKDADRVAIAAGNRCGRTGAMAWTAITHCLFNPRALVVMSTPSAPNLRGTVYRAIGSQIERANIEAEVHRLPIHGVEFPNGSRIIGVASNDGSRLQGYSADGPILVLIDEAFGYAEDLWDALLSNVAGGGAIIAGGNPVVNTGPMADIFVKEKPGWLRLHFSSLDAAKAGIKGLATMKWCEARLVEYGEESILYRGRVLGQLSDMNATGLLALSEILQAQQRHEALAANAFREDSSPLRIGADIARTGLNDTVLFPIRGRIAGQPEILRLPDLVMVADRIVALVRELRRQGEIPEVRVDAVGIGAGVVDILKRSDEVRVIEVQAAASASRDAYANVRSECAFQLRDWVRDGGAIPRLPRLEREMSVISYEFDSRNRLRIRGKDEIKALLGGASTDMFDSLALAVYGVAKKSVAQCWAECDEDPNFLRLYDSSWHYV